MRQCLSQKRSTIVCCHSLIEISNRHVVHLELCSALAKSPPTESEQDALGVKASSPTTKIVLAMEMLSSLMRMAILDMIFGSFHLAKPAKFTSFCPTTGISIALFVMDTVPLCL